MKINIFYRKKQAERHSIEKVYDSLLPYFRDFNVEIIELPFISKGFLRRIFNILFATIKQATINHISGDIHYINLLMRKKTTILTIHDIYPIHRTTGWRRWLLKLFWFELPIKRSNKIITVSNFSKTEIVKHFNISPNKIKVIPNCISSGFEPFVKNFNNEQPSILHLGTKPNKNLINLISAINGLTIKLIIIGELNVNEINKLVENKIDYIRYNNVSDEQLLVFYQQTDIVSFISTYEGFGLPIIEAQAIGRSVITSNVASMPEIAGEGALLVNPFSVKKMREGILKLINDVELRDKLIQKGLENVKRFEPQKIANQYLEVYKEVMNE